MTHGDWVAVIVPLISAVSSLMAFFTARVAVRRVDEVHVLMNSRLTELLEITRQAAHAAGVAEGQTTSVVASAVRAQGVLDGQQQAADAAAVLERR